MKKSSSTAGCGRAQAERGFRLLFRAVLFAAAFILHPSSPVLAQSPGGGGGNTGPIDIVSEGGTTYRDRIATAVGNVSIETDDAIIYADSAEYNLDSKEALLVGNVRIFRVDTTFFAERALYNFNTKAIRALDFDSSRAPYYFGGTSVFSPGAGYQYNARASTFSTHDSSKPDYRLRSRRLRIYPDDRAIYVGTTLYIGTTPVFYFPYFYQSLDQQSGYTIVPGYKSEYGAFLQLGVTFPVTDKLTGLARLDYRSARGFAAGVNLEWKPNRRSRRAPDGGRLGAYASDDDPGRAAVVPSGPASTNQANTPAGRGVTTADVAGTNTSADTEEDDDDRSAEARAGRAATGERLSREIRNYEGAKLTSYFAKDDKPDLNRTSLNRSPTSPERYRLGIAGTQFFTDHLSLKADVDKLSDRYLLQDFFQGEFTRNPQPDNIAFLTYAQPDYVATLFTRVQLNNFFNTTERLPELSLDVPRHPIFGLKLNYESENSAGYLHRAFANDSLLPSYSAYRLDTFHQLTLPQTYGGWLSVVPKLGARATYYTRSAPGSTRAFNLLASNEDDLRSLFTLFPNPDPLSNEGIAQNQIRQARREFDPGGGIFRPVLNAGVETSFKISRVYPQIQSRALGLDRLQHIVQPYLNLAYIEDFGVGSRRLLPFDRRLPTTQLDPIDFPQFTAIDSIDEGAFARIGVRNRFQTKRDALTFNWLEVDTFFQANIVNPYGPARVSNVFNQVNFRPMPWVTLTLDTQVPVFDSSTAAARGGTNLSTGSTFIDLLSGNTPNRSIGGFTEVNTALNLQATSSLDLEISHRYLSKNPFFQNSSLVQFGAYYRIDPNWAVSFRERYEFADRVVEAQSYTLHRDLTSFIASLGVTVRDNRGVNDFGVLVNFTLKDVPKVNLPVGFDVQSLENQLSGN